MQQCGVMQYFYHAVLFTTRVTRMHSPLKNSFILLMSCHSFCCHGFSEYLYRVCARVWYRLTIGKPPPTSEFSQ